ncbi:hypothetical protein H5V45_13640 [Nocardioides sp. KIGAM211]|uniref:Uncharacterized protein n=1 Tax=Nocardioides luti TaxID=2761101 RepID=A0A7X0VB16_9ACTN|nr:hypothetical protein [Nocardioides luti]MBB6628364.1 hypothetical protein [Nocardioides luti]
MIAWSTTGSAAAVAHGIHYALLGIGFAGLAALLVPQLLERHPTAARPVAAPRTEHERRVRQLRARLAAGTVATLAAAPVAPAPAAPRAAPPTPRRTPSGAASRLLLPAALVGSAAAAGTHAAVGPAHFEEGLLLGLFFATSALAQLGWAVLALRRTSARLLLVGVAGNLAIVVLWAVTRTWGLPFGLLPGPEAVGPWDLAALGWELVTAAACARLLQQGRTRVRIAPWSLWHPAARAWVLVSVLLLGVLSSSGAAA